MKNLQVSKENLLDFCQKAGRILSNLEEIIRAVLDTDNSYYYECQEAQELILQLKALETNS